MDSEHARQTELRGRFVAMAVACAMFWVVLDLRLPAFWLMAYALIVALRFNVLIGGKQTESRRDIQTAYSVIFATSLLFAALPLLLWESDTPASRVGAVAAVIGMALYNVMRPTTSYKIVLIDASIVCALAFYFGADFALEVRDKAPIALNLLFILLICIYYLLTVRDWVDRQRRLRRVANRNIQASKMEAIGQMTGGIAHAFNNLLTVILGNLELYAQADRPLEKREYFEEAEKAARRAALLTAQLTAFSRKAPLQPQPVLPGDFMRDTYDMMRPLVPESIEFDLEVEAVEATVLVDPQQLENALFNLILNARDALGAGGAITISVLPRRLNREQVLGGVQLSPGDYCRIAVTDTGRGIADEHLPRVTEPFFTTKPIGKGTGLGLSMVRGFAEQSGGALLIETAEDIGTTVSILLPLANWAATEPGKTLHAQEATAR